MLKKALRYWPEAILGGVFYALALWGVTSIPFLGEPKFVHHHLTAFLIWVGLVYALGLRSGWRDGKRAK